MKLLSLMILLAISVWYGGFLKSLLASSSWGWLSLMFVWPFVLAYVVGNEADRADFHKIRDWLAAKLRIR